MADLRAGWAERALIGLAAPLLAVQALTVILRALKLPEADGPRDGVAGTGPPLRLLILGDSSAAGVGARTQAAALSGQVVAGLAHRHRVTWRLLARTGATTARAARFLDQIEGQPFDVVVIALGVNDVTRGVRGDLWQAHTAGIIDQLRRAHGVTHICLTALPPMALFPLLPRPLSTVLGRQVDRLNRRMAAMVATDDGLTMLTLDLPPDRDFMAEDGFHPAPRTYAIWGALAAERIIAQAGGPDPAPARGAGR